ncbi:glycoside hydrolase family 38 C-terminal domain-containing protein [Parabacteroides goldsteinii]|uniref:glycoside hydrolase family 38 N-terminal domain-containing protein n=1 Tax=Parabacteroides goldsteinii TaxID=328812 RepID=UPI003991FC67
MKLSVAILSLAILSGGNASFAQTDKQDKKAKAYMVADAHLDTQWNWDIQTTIKEYVWNTLSQNLFLLKRYPDYVFNFEGGVKYAWMKEYYPAQYEEMKEYIRNGRWHISGSSWDATDVLVPSTESFIRNILLGQEYYRKEFGVESTDIFLPDCFGFGWTLPTIAAHCGLIGFSSQKLDWRNHPFYGKSKHPFMIGLWKGVDGASIMLAHGYDYGRRWKDEDLSESNYLLELSKRNPFNIVYRYYGTGDTGGSPNLASVRSVEKGIKGDGPVEVISATSDQMFKDFMPYDKHPELPVFDGELLMDVHGTGCYTSEAAMKLYNRQNEVLANAAENAAVAADWLGTAAYPLNTLTDAWKRFIVHQFHDDLTGTSIPRAYEFSWNDELISLKQFAGVLTSSVSAVAGQLDTRVKGIPVILYNAHSFPVTDLAEVVLDMPKSPKGFTVYDDKGKKVAAQMLSYDNGKVRLLIAASVPASGYAVYDVREGGSVTRMVSVEANALENSMYKIRLDGKGDIVSLLDKKNNKELVKEGKAIRLALFTENKSYNWPAWEIMKETIDKEPVSITEDVKISQIENGELRKSLCIEKRHGQSVFKQYIRLYEGSRADRIDFYNEIDWQSTNALLKAEFPLSVSNPEATYDLGIGSVKRGNNTQTAYEVYAQYWADLTDANGSYGVSVLNDSKYGWDKPNDHTIRLTLLHTPETKGGYAYQDRQDFGYHTFTYSLLPHSGGFGKAQTGVCADKLNQPIMAFAANKHAGRLGKSFSFVNSDNTSVVIKTLKKAQVSDELVVRVYETGGVKEQTAEISFADAIVSASEADGTEKTIGKASFTGNKLQVSVKPNSVKTFKVKLKPSDVPVDKLQYASLPLNYNKKCVSWNEFRREADFASGYSYAAELLPDSIVVSSIPFSLGEKEAANGLTCKGDTIELPAGDSYNRIYFLAASREGDSEGTFRLGKTEHAITVPEYTGFIGQWGHLGHTEGFLKEAEIAYVGTHRHAPEGDEAYEYTYMFKFGMDIPKGATQLVLPDNKDIVLFAVTVVKEENPQVTPASELFRTALKPQQGDKANAPKANLMKGAKVIACSGFVNEEESPERMIDGDTQTKWCDITGVPNYADFDLGETKNVSGWKLVNAGQESHSYVTRTCFLQGKNSLSEEWKTLGRLDDNRKNEVTGLLTKPESVRYIRLLIAQPSQDTGSRDARIYELEVY